MHNNMDTPTELQRVMTRYTELLEKGSEAEARAFVLEEFPKLPQDVREQVLGEMLTMAIEDKVEEREATKALHEEGIAAFKALDEMEKKAKEKSQERP